jgi:hypothetical protein
MSRDITSRAVELNPRVITRAMCPHIVWRHDNSPVYDAQGYFRHTLVWANFGATQTDLRALGPWFPMKLVPRKRFGIPCNLPPAL